VKSNNSTDITPEQRISDEDILHNINTFMFAGSDTSSLSVTWTLLLLAQHPAVQTKLRHELSTIAPAGSIKDLTHEEIDSLYNEITELPYLNNVVRESLRFIPPVHSSLRVATQDDEIPTSHPVKTRMSDGSVVDGLKSVKVPKGSFVHVPIEAFNLDKEIWGDDAWEFKYAS
jgi:cytochrome P450